MVNLNTKRSTNFTAICSVVIDDGQAGGIHKKFLYSVRTATSRTTSCAGVDRYCIAVCFYETKKGPLRIAALASLPFDVRVSSCARQIAALDK